MHEINMERHEESSGTVLPIRTLGDPVLRERCRTVDDLGPGLKKLITDMFTTMYDAQGVGLAATQVGVDLRVFVFDCPDHEDKWHKGYVINPVVKLAEAGVKDEHLEGCLSIPGMTFDLDRPGRVIVEGIDLHGRTIEIEGYEFFARCLLHETGHLEGTLVIDLLQGAERRAALKSLNKLQFDRRNSI
jgi:peptide deformylase